MSYDMRIKTVRKVKKNTSLAIDLYLSKEDLKVIYDRWGTGVTKFGWDIPISMRGGISTITCAMMKKIPFEQLKKVFYTKRAQRIMDAMSRVS
ncbi:MAG TPA: hypothetical protein ENG48_11065 [Candidatus Atribacteria bacterium]|nr:hypothetical protein [Candidatus Atribacteria bacterium]